MSDDFVTWEYNERDPNKADRYRIEAFLSPVYRGDEPEWVFISPTPSFPGAGLEPNKTYEIRVTPVWDDED